MDDGANETAQDLTPAEGADGSAEGGSPPTQPGAPVAPSPVPAPRRSRKAKRRKAKRTRPVKVAPAEGAARDAAAAAALAEIDPAPPEADPEYVAAPPEGEAAQVEAPDYPPERAAEDLAAVLRLGMRGLGVVLRRKGFGTAAASMWEGAEVRAGMMGAALGERAAARFGGKLALAGIVAALAEPFLSDLWEKSGEGSR